MIYFQVYMVVTQFSLIESEIDLSLNNELASEKKERKKLNGSLQIANVAQTPVRNPAP